MTAQAMRINTPQFALGNIAKALRSPLACI